MLLLYILKALAFDLDQQFMPSIVISKVSTSVTKDYDNKDISEMPLFAEKAKESHSENKDVNLSLNMANKEIDFSRMPSLEFTPRLNGLEFSPRINSLEFSPRMSNQDSFSKINNQDSFPRTNNQDSFSKINNQDSFPRTNNQDSFPRMAPFIRTIVISRGNGQPLLRPMRHRRSMFNDRDQLFNHDYSTRKNVLPFYFEQIPNSVRSASAKNLEDAVKGKAAPMPEKYSMMNIIKISLVIVLGFVIGLIGYYLGKCQESKNYVRVGVPSAN